MTGADPTTPSRAQAEAHQPPQSPPLPPPRSTIVRLSPPQSPGHRASGASFGDAYDDSGRRYTPRTLVESAAKKAAAAANQHSGQAQASVCVQEQALEPQKQPPKQSWQAQNAAPRLEQGRDAADSDQRHRAQPMFLPPMPPVLAQQASDSRPGSIQFLGPQRQTVMRMSMDGPAAASPHTRNSSSDGTATNSRDSPDQPPGARAPLPALPQPIGTYAPVDEKILQRNPGRFTSDGLRRKEPIYQLYDHDNCHPLCGRTVTGTRPAPFALALAMLSAPVVLFAVFVCPYLWYDLHKAAVIVFAYLAALTYASMLMASFTDPGIIPRNLDAITPPDAFAVDVNAVAQPARHQSMPPGLQPHAQSSAIDSTAPGPGEKHRSSSGPPESLPRHRPPLQYYDRLPPPWVQVGTPGRRSSPLSVYDPVAPAGGGQRPGSDSYRMYPPTTKLVTINNVNVRLKYCDTCRIYRPPRASHCRSCDNCVENEDHHCIWLNNCIGRRNYRYFYSFLVSITLLALYIFAFSLVRLIRPINQDDSELSSFGQSVKHHPMVLVLLLYVFVHIGFVGGLLVYHTMLISRNMTTHELLGARHAHQTDADSRSGSRHYRSPFFFAAASPYSKGSCLRNWAAALCSPMTPTNVRWRARVDPEGIEELIPLHR
ncbi:Eukaryotic peptide chain release factor GTP-binding subunit [Coemansia thaxteri]|nr:Eukaryotic peptide chain release factor GTP-binding subunit [Coemansia thaxteri]KAJ2470167.1 Eukaryotic peptide chain release factor GTP-binding subunit [Coemansia sp. RSA 2322]